jgi:hypothetical protein
MAVARHVPSMTAAMAHHYSLNDQLRLRTLLEAAQFRDVDVILESRSFSFPSFDAYFEPFELGGGPWGAHYVALSANLRNQIREEVRHGLATGADGSIEIGVDILFGSGTK